MNTPARSLVLFAVLAHAGLAVVDAYARGGGGGGGGGRGSAAFGGANSFNSNQTVRKV